MLGDKHIEDISYGPSDDERKSLHKLFETLQLITLSNITTADGFKINPEMVNLKKITTRKTRLY